MDETASVTIRCLNAGSSSRALDVFIDAKRKGGVRPGEPVTIDLVPGRHSVEIANHTFTKTLAVSFNVDHKSNVNFDCGFNMKRFVLLIIVMIAITFGIDFVRTQPASLQYAQLLFFAKPFAWIGFVIAISRPGMLLWIKQVSIEPVKN